MKKTIITFLLALVFPITASAQLESVKEFTMKSEFFNHERQVLIYTPVGYQQYDQTPASIACGRETLGWESNIRNDIDGTLENYIKFRALCIYLFDYMHSSVDVEL